MIKISINPIIKNEDMNFVKLLTDNSVLLTCASLVFSCSSLLISARTAILDRQKIVIKARPYVYDRGDGRLFNHLELFVYNHGRRDAAIDRIIYKYSDGYSIYHGGEKDPIVLKENQRKIIKIDYEDLVVNGEEGEVHFLEDIIIVDVRGKEFTVPNCKALIDKVHQTS